MVNKVGTKAPSKKINLAILLPEYSLGGGYKKYISYANSIDKALCNLTLISVNSGAQVIGEKSKQLQKAKSDFSLSVIPVDQHSLRDFLKLRDVMYVYCAASLSDKILDSLAKDFTLIFNVNFIPTYKQRNNALYFAISQTLYYKMVCTDNVHVPQTAVVYNPIPVDKWRKLAKKRDKAENKYANDNLIIGRLARSEPSKWDFLILATLFRSQFKKYQSKSKSDAQEEMDNSASRKASVRKISFLLAGCPLLYRAAIRVFCPFADVKFLPQLVNDEQIASFYNSIDIFWQASSAGETFGNVIAESYCFGKPVISDCKDFILPSGKILTGVDNAQIELVDDEKTGRILYYPSTILDYLTTVSRKEIEQYGKNARELVSNFDAKTASNTLLKYIYLHARTYGFSKLPAQPAFEKLTLFPQNFENYGHVYSQKVAFADERNDVSHHEYVLYKFFSKLWSIIEFVYLVVRKLLRFMRIPIDQ